METMVSNRHTSDTWQPKLQLNFIYRVA